MNSLYDILAVRLAPLTSPFYTVALLLLTAVVFKKTKSAAIRVISLAAFTAVFWLAYEAVLSSGRGGDTALWLGRFSSPMVLVVPFIVLPAILLPRNGWYNLFLLLPASCIALAAIEVYSQYARTPAGSGFAWLMMRPAFLFAAAAGFLVIMQRFLTLDHFRKLTRVTMLLILLYGGFAIRRNWTDYKEMLARRPDVKPDIMKIEETTPVLKDDNRLGYIPAAPCRFSADGGYVQGCNMELSQRIMQVNLVKAAAGDPGSRADLAIALAAMLFVVALCFIGARWWCGWACPLSTIGDALNWLRRLFGLPHHKPAQPLKVASLVSGLSLSTFGLLLAKAYPHLDENGMFLGCKIPLYPFCKICPGQQVCPVASKGPGGYAGLPSMDWMGGFFKITCITLLGFFILGFITSRRLWCRFCPMGMLGGIFNRGGMLALKKDARKCNGCGACNEACPMDIHLVQEEMKKEDVSSFDCVYCLKCVDRCPQDKCLRAEFAGAKVAESEFIKDKNGKTV